MPLFGFLKRRIETRPDLVWQTSARKWDGLADEVERLLGEDALVIVVAHFKTTLADAHAALQPIVPACSVCDFRIDRGRLLCDVDERCTGRLWLATAEQLGCDDLPSPGIDRTRCVSVIVVERHPLRARDAAVEAFARSVPFRCRLGYHISLEDPLLGVFTNAWAGRVFRMLGFSPDDPISGDLFARHLRRAHKKIERQAIGDEPCDSAEEWLARNCPAVPCRRESHKNSGADPPFGMA